MESLFEPEPTFDGLPRDGFAVFAIPDRRDRRREILGRIHPALTALGEDLTARLNRNATKKLHYHLPRLDWPRGYQPFCTWLALSFEGHGYQRGPQLNVGVHADHVALRLGWDTAADAFGRFEFLGKHGHLDEELGALIGELGLRYRVYAAAPWPEGSRLVFESETDLRGSFLEVRRHGVWWEMGRRLEFPAEEARIVTPDLGKEAAELFERLLPTYERIAIIQGA